MNTHNEEGLNGLDGRLFYVSAGDGLYLCSPALLFSRDVSQALVFTHEQVRAFCDARESRFNNLMPCFVGE